MLENDNLPKEEEVIIVWGDLTNFVKILNAKGNLELYYWLSEYSEFVGKEVELNDGTVLKYIADGFIAIFPANKVKNIENILEKLQNDVNDMLKNKGIDSQIYIKASIGKVALGEIGTKNNRHIDIFGNTVNELFKIKSDKLVFSKELLEKLNS